MSLTTGQKNENTCKYCLGLLREFLGWIMLEIFLLSFLGLLILLEIFLYFLASSERNYSKKKLSKQKIANSNENNQSTNKYHKKETESKN